MPKSGAHRKIKFMRRHSIIMRDDFLCAYCGRFDYPAHVMQTYSDGVRLRHRQLAIKKPLPDNLLIIPRKEKPRKTPEAVFIQGRLTIDHINPKSFGGNNALYNLVTACASCNRKKGNDFLLPPLLHSDPDAALYGRCLEVMRLLFKQNKQNKLHTLHALNRLILKWQKNNSNQAFIDWFATMNYAELAQIPAK